MVRRALVVASLVVLSSGCGASSSSTVDSDDCMAAKKHLCDNIAGQACSTSTMDNAKNKVSGACSAASAVAYFPWVEQACSARTLNCAALPRFTTAGASCTTSTDFHYSGTATADGRSATLDLTVKGTAVTGTLHAEPVCQPNVHLTRTDLTFTGTLAGVWEGEGSLIQGDWTGGDYDCDGKLVSGYPTSGSISISQFNGKLSLKRVTGGWEYSFTTIGKTVPGCSADAG